MGFALGVGVVVLAFSAIELWSNLYHDPFLPNVKEQGWTVLRFNLYGAGFVAAIGSAACFFLSGFRRDIPRRPSRTTLLAAAFLGAVTFMLLHHSRHVLNYWESGGTW